MHAVRFDRLPDATIEFVPAKPGGTDCATRVPGGRLNPYAPHNAFPQQSSVGHAVQCDATGQAKIVETRFLAQGRASRMTTSSVTD